MKQVAKMLGLELEEEFKVTYRGDDKYVFTKEGFYRVRDDGLYLIPNPEIVLNLLMGRYEIIKLPKSILDDKEKEYLSNLIKPYRKYVKYIKKSSYMVNERITIYYREYIGQYTADFSLPSFEKGTMYKGMEIDKDYNLKELGL